MTQPQPTQRLSFSQTVPNHQIAWDSTSLGALKRCPRYYQYNIVEGYTTREESVHLRFGIDYNNALVTFHKARAKGASYEEATFAAVRYALEATWDNKLGRPWTSDMPEKNRETLVRTVVWYLDRFQDDQLETYVLADGTPAVELAFRIHIEHSSYLSGEEYQLCGYNDRVVNFADAKWITDFKTSRYQIDEKYFRQYSPNNQVSQYSFCGQIMLSSPIAGVIIDAVQLGATFSRFQRSQITRSKPQLEEWFLNTLRIIRLNEQYVAENYWPMNDAVCSMYGGCPYQRVCSVSPELRQKHLDALYVKRIWDPLQEREI